MRSPLLIFLPLFVASTLGAHGAGLAIDHRYAPERQYTLLSFPFDWQKTILLGNGNLAYDFGPGPYHAAGTEIGFTISGAGATVERQFFADPSVPIATTRLRSGAGMISMEAFSLVPDSFETPATFTAGRVTRIGHLAGAVAWSGAPGTPYGAFRNAAWGTNRPVLYRVAVPRGSRKAVALGVCEPYKQGPRQRVLELRVEGALPRIFDPREGVEKNTPSVILFDGGDANADGALEIEAHCAPESPDPNVILNAFWVFPEGTRLSAENIAAGRPSQQPELFWQCGTELSRLSPVRRHDALIATSDSPGGIPPLTLTTRRPVAYDRRTGVIDLGIGMSIRCSPPPEAGAPAEEGGTVRWTFPFPRGTQNAEIIVASGTAPERPGTPADLELERSRARQYWRTLPLIPRDVIRVPDPDLQTILDVNIRNLYQAADIAWGAPVFQPGPTVYRGLFLLDVMMIGEPLMLLGDTASVRRYLEGTFGYQQPDGRVRVAEPYNAWIETPAFVNALCWYARWTQNREWMHAQWPRVVRAIEWIRRARESTMRDSSAPNFGLFPAGFVDGGLAGAVADFSTASFTLAALEEASCAARWLGHTEEEEQWRAMFDGILQSYLRAARRSVRTDRFGNRFLPVAIGDTSSSTPPQRGQYGFFMPLRYAQYYEHPAPFIDSLIDGNLAMLESALHEGMVIDAGWTRDAVWAWFAAMHATTLSWRGRHDQAAAMVYDVANHSGHLGTWVEEQQIKGRGTHSTGDGANAETSAYFITAVRNLLAVERDSTTEILPGAPAAWYRAGARMSLRNAPTAHGRMNLEARVSADGSVLDVSVSMSDIPQGKSRSISLSTRSARAAGFLLQEGESRQRTLAGSSAPPCVWKLIKKP